MENELGPLRYKCRTCGSAWFGDKLTPVWPDDNRHLNCRGLMERWVLVLDDEPNDQELRDPHD